MKQGTVIGINDNELTIQAVCQTACADCHQKQNCLLTEYKKKTFSIKVADSIKYHIGQQVELNISLKTMTYSICFAYILPLICLLMVMGLLSYMEYSETICAVGSLLSLGGYYLILKYLQNWLQKKIKPEIKENPVD